MLAFFVSLFTMLVTPTGLATAPAPAPVVAAAASAPATGGRLDWLGGTWKTDALEMICEQTKLGIACSEEGTSAAMKGAKAELAFDTAGDKARLRVALPSIPPSTFTEVAREGQSVTFEMPTKMGVARLRFTRTGDALKVERGNADSWATAMAYRRG
ncbi:hypothetical protein FPZ54_08230 [Sphingomonas suaedae]|uniref:Uncharacterized protein n=1 Tax=Sphingomonas suaedae TaxID=2599297 RepID=A0A518REW0_9SPHN|nr:hypothetical protein [Sphingomonas suaedae]QDX26010.1 hypothetical protein FPZ54_08230 [Sphingomonas suaedae]